MELAQAPRDAESNKGQFGHVLVVGWFAWDGGGAVGRAIDGGLWRHCDPGPGS